MPELQVFQKQRFTGKVKKFCDVIVQPPVVKFVGKDASLQQNHLLLICPIPPRLQTRVFPPPEDQGIKRSLGFAQGGGDHAFRPRESGPGKMNSSVYFMADLFQGKSTRERNFWPFFKLNISLPCRVPENLCTLGSDPLSGVPTQLMLNTQPTHSIFDNAHLMPGQDPVI